MALEVIASMTEIVVCKQVNAWRYWLVLSAANCQCQDAATYKRDDL